MKKQKVSIIERILRVEYPTIGKTFVADTSKYNAVIQDCARDHGFKQKFGDAASGGTPQEKFAEVQAIHLSLMNGEWERTATIDLTPVICRVVAKIKGLPLPKVEAIAKKNPDMVKTWGSNPKVRAAILEERAEKARLAAAESDDEIEIDIK